jgi:hypothetical protein
VALLLMALVGGSAPALVAVIAAAVLFFAVFL